MAIVKPRFKRGIIIRPDDIGVDSIEGEIKVGTTSKELHVYLDGALRSVVTKSQIQTLTNKTIDADNNTITDLEVDNLKAGVLNTNIALLDATDTQLPSALATKTLVENNVSILQDNIDTVQDNLSAHEADTVDAHDATAISFTYPGLSGTNISDALIEVFETGDAYTQAVENQLNAHIADAVDAHDASAISNVPSGNLSATDQQSVNNELQADIDTRATSSALTSEISRATTAEALVQTNLDNHIADTVDAHDASAISVTPSGNLSSTDAQAALVELQGDINTINADIADDVEGPASATDNAIARYDGTTGKLIQNSGILARDDNFVQASGVTNSASDAGLTVVSGSAAVFGDSVNIQGAVFYDVVQDSSTNGTAVILNAGNNKTVYLSNAGLVSIAGITGTIDGRELILTNGTGAAITILHNNVGAGAEAINTGTGSDLTLNAASSISLTFNDTVSRWFIIGGTGSGNGGSGTSDPDVLLVQTFDEAVGGDFSIVGSGFSLATTNTINGDQSVKLEHDSVSTLSFSQENISVPMKFRGVNMTGYAVIRSTASSGNVTLTVTDETNSATLQTLSLQTDSTSATGDTSNGSALLTGMSQTATSELEVGMSVTGPGIITGTVLIAVGSTFVTLSNNAISTNAAETYRFSALPKTLQFGFNIPSDCESIAYTVTALPEADAPETYIDDIKLANYWTGTSNQGQSTISVPTITQQSSDIRAQATSFGAGATITGSLTTQVGSGLYSYNSGTGIYTVLEDANFVMSLILRASTTVEVVPTIYIDGNTVATSHSAAVASRYATTSYSGILTTGQTFWFANNNSTTNLEYLSVSATGVTTTEVTTNDLVPAKAVLGNSTIDVPTITQQSQYLSSSSSISGGSPVTGAATSQSGSGLFSYNSGTGVYTMLEDADVTISYAGQSSGATNYSPIIELNGTEVARANSVASSGYATTAVYTGVIAEGSTFRCISGTNAGNSHKVSVSATCVVTNEVTISGTQQLVTDVDDTCIRLSGANGYGSTATTTRRFSSIVQNIGSDIVYTDSSTNGASFTAQTAGTYSISYTEASDVSSTTSGIVIKINGTVVAGNRDISSAATTTARYNNASWSGYLNEGDVVTPEVFIAAANDGDAAYFTISKINAAKVVQTVADQKIEIPTSELRFEGASARGATATAIVKFDTLAKIRGDAFTVTNTTNDGTYVTMTKAGKLDVVTSIGKPASNVTIQITKNQSTLTSISSTASEVIGLQQDTPATSSYSSCSASVFVNVGDIIRVASNGTPAAGYGNFLDFSFQEQSIAVSVSNTLPQFSESDSCIRLNTSNGYGSTNNKIRRFSNLTQNIGSDIVYADSATDGASFTIRTAGIYSISYTDDFTLSTSDIGTGLSLNSTQLTTGIATIDVGSRLCLQRERATAGQGVTLNCFWEGYLNVGDIIRPHVDIADSNTPARVAFTISKVGRPNVTGVDVTPFISIPQPEKQTSFLSGNGYGSTATTTLKFNSPTSTSGSGIFSYTSDSVNGDTFTVLKNAIFHISINGPYSSGAEALVYIRVNGTSISAGECAIGTRTSQSVTRLLQVGDQITFNSSLASNPVNDSGTYLNIVAEANSDSILTPIETFSTDTASLTYAGSASYTLSTLANAPVGTFITYTYASSSNTRTQTTTAPTQTTSDMNTNGILIYTRAYNATSTAAQPSVVAIQIGKGLKGLQLGLYKSSGKTTAGGLDWFTHAATTAYGMPFKDYNEVTGILVLDAGYQTSSSNAAHTFNFSDASSQTSGYVVINASKNPALAGLGLNQIGARYTSNSGQSIPTSTTVMKYEDIIRDSHNAYNTTTGVYTVPESGWYQVNAAFGTASVTLTTSQAAAIRIYVNGVIVNSARALGNGSAMVYSPQFSDVQYFNKNDQVDVRADSSVATTMFTDNSYNTFSIVKVSI